MMPALRVAAALLNCALVVPAVWLGAAAGEWLGVAVLVCWVRFCNSML